MPPNQSVPRGRDEPFSSPLFNEVVKQFGRATRHVILELDWVSSGVLDMLYGKRCRLLVSDATQAFYELNKQSQEKEILSQKVKSLVIDGGKEKIDTVLCWDLLNYLSPPLLKAFTTHLVTIMKPTGVVHGYIHSMQDVMPERPQHYQVLKDGLVTHADQAIALGKAPRYSFWDLEKHATGLRVDRSMLLRNGIQEYLLRVDTNWIGLR
jgi:hypothetical protein